MEYIAKETGMDLLLLIFDTLPAGQELLFTDLRFTVTSRSLAVHHEEELEKMRVTTTLEPAFSDSESEDEGEEVSPLQLVLNPLDEKDEDYDGPQVPMSFIGDNESERYSSYGYDIPTGGSAL